MFVMMIIGLTTTGRNLKTFCFHSSLVERVLGDFFVPSSLGKYHSFRYFEWARTVIFMDFGRNVDECISIRLSPPEKRT